MLSVHPRIIGPSIFDQIVNAESRLEMISEQFHPEFCAFENSSELIFMQDGAPTTGLKQSGTG